MARERSACYRRISEGHDDGPQPLSRFGWTQAQEFWTSPGKVDTPQPHFEARSNASGLTPPRWLWRRVRL